LKHLALLLLPALLIGCSQPPTKLPEQIELDKQQQKAETKGDLKMVQSDPGNTTIFVKDRVKAWEISWKRAELDFELDQSTFGGKLIGVKGTLFRDGKEASTFVSERAVVVRGSKVLKLEGGTKITSVDPGGKVECETAWYDGDTGLIRAEGGILAEYQGYRMSGVPAIMADSQLRMIATPDMFDREKLKKTAAR
jgi:hypothetical protein